MSDLRESKFWVNLLNKVLQQVLKNLGVKSRRNTNNQHVVPHEDGWAVRGEGNERLTGTYDSQQDAIGRARDIAKNYRSSVIIHRRDGTIRDRVSYKRG